ncbi:MAG: hypothetical protein IJ217_03065 [Clostridia bacterium]|nr:hypothetical protein [Clostridia bacterium]
MNKKWIWIIVILLIAVIIFAKCFSNNKNEEEFKPIDKNIGDEFTELSYPNKMFIVNYEIADVTGDGEKDMILLIGEAESGEGLSDATISNMDVVVYDTSNSQFIKADASKLSGKNNRMTVADFTGDQILDIMITSDNGKNSARIYTYENGKLKEIWKERNNKGLVFIGEFKDGFKVEINNKKLNLSKVLDLPSENYVEASFYNNSGKLLSDKKSISTSGFTSIEVIKLNDRNGLRTLQRIYGMNDNDILDEIGTVWKYSEGKWQMVEVKGLKLGNLLY